MKWSRIYVPVIGVSLLLGLMGGFVWFSSEMLTTHFKQRMDVEKWIELEDSTLHALTHYVETRDSTYYVTFKRRLSDLQKQVFFGRLITSKTIDKDSVINILATKSNNTRQQIKNSVWLIQMLRDFNVANKAITKWRQLAATASLIDSVGGIVHNKIISTPDNQINTAALLETVNRLKSRITTRQKATQSYLRYTTRWLAQLFQRGNLLFVGILWVLSLLVIGFIYKRNAQQERQLRITTEKFSKLFKYSPLPIIFLDKKGRIQQANESFHKLFGFSQEEAMGRSINELITPEKYRKEARDLDKQTLQGKTVNRSVIRQDKSGNQLNLIITTVPIEIDEHYQGFFSIYTDITEQKESQQKLEKSLKEREVLIQEIHHRVKNNLTVTAGMLDLQAQTAEHPETKEKLEDSKTRIHSIAAIHELLYQSEHYSDITFDKYIKRLTEHNVNSLASGDKKITTNIHADPVRININQAIPCGLLLNELITNALKHAFTDRDQGTLTISFSEDTNTGEIHLTVEDDGVGMPEAELESTDSLGMSIIHNLTDQLDGQITFNSDNGDGTRITCTFPKEEIKDSITTVNV